MRLTFYVTRYSIGAASAAILGVLAVVALLVAMSSPAIPKNAPLSGTTVAFAVPRLPPAWPLSLIDKSTRSVEGELRRGDTFAQVLHRAGVSASLIDEIATAIADDFDVRRLRAGRPYKVFFGGNDELLLFRYQPDRQTAQLVARGATGWRSTKVIVPYDIRARFVHANILGSLEGALSATWIQRRDAIQLSRKLADIFAWDIDFAADLRVNDSVDVIVEQRFLEGTFVGFGDVLAADLRIAGRMYRAVRYQRAGTATAYYRPSGESLQRAFLRSPVDYSRISSGFSYRRLHPVLDVVRPHYGVDYVAPAGTPVHATANGTVVHAGRSRDAGNYVKIRHGSTYTSWYLHLSGFAAGLDVGDKVEQGQVLGFVGRTGLVTSVHLDYRLEQNGTFVDPLKIEFPAAKPLAAALMGDFAIQRDAWLVLLRAGQNDRPAVLAGSGE